MTRYALNDDWKFTPTWDDALLGANAADAEGLEPVRLPHTVAELPLDSFDDHDFQLLSGYVRALDVPASWADRTVRLVLDGAAHRAEVFCNGALVGVHECGWTAAEFDLTAHLEPGRNVLAVRLDSRETLDQPPFGGVVDYLAYGGLYREAHLEVTPRERLADVFVRADHRGALTAEVAVANARPGLALLASVVDASGAVLASSRTPIDEAGAQAPKEGAETGAVSTLSLDLRVPNARAWSPKDPTLHVLRCALVDANGSELDARDTRFGFRTIAWAADGLYVNGERVHLRGLNRHQSYPYMGYAAPARAQRLDADIVKDELGCTVVRTSHYPQSHHFIDRCDEIGLLVVTELPGWQHIGGDAWKDRAVRNVRDMVLQWRNHPSIIAWGVRINESADDDALYERTNAAAHELDSTRPTTGIRNFQKSHLLEDVYAYNDFVHSGGNRGCDPKKRVTPDASKGYLISEHNGHMYPTKAWDDEEHRLSQALRHARVQNDAAAGEGISGAIGWCFADYQTHRDFGSGDRVCHHGVLDQFRNPKLAAALYASQADLAEGEEAILVPSSSMDIGEHPGGALGTIAVFTNADSVRLYRNDDLVGEFAPDPKRYGALPHPPVLIEDTVGELLERHEGLDHRTSEQIKKVLRDAAKYGPAGLPPATMATAAWLMTAKGFTLDEGTRLYNRWMASWGGEAVVWRFDAVKDGLVVASARRAPGNELQLVADVDTTRLVDGKTWDLATVRIRAIDEYGAPRTYARRVVRISLEGDAALVGPDVIDLAGGGAGTYVRTLGRAGSARLTLSCDGAEPVSIDFTIEREGAPTWN
ncbi:glycoside hydrolase family 2 protein [Actinomyces culturomici]|uniref:glycoside hydrolase family 2 protein n=1 Tax=Actinomyces culturomici TaxID=1926276 RepID=UPI000E2011FC|nr:glycoside hydrolase family 2 TIM barrel-domain containing protein [Actinomyces culturomici]